MAGEVGMSWRAWELKLSPNLVTKGMMDSRGNTLVLPISTVLGINRFTQLRPDSKVRLASAMHSSSICPLRKP